MLLDIKFPRNNDLVLNPQEKNIIASLMRDIIKNTESDFKKLAGTDRVTWKKVRDFLEKGGLWPFLYKYLKQEGVVPLDLYPDLEKSYWSAYYRNYLFQNIFYSVNKECRKNKVMIVPLKGMGFLLELYKAPCRPMVDLDILVKEEDLNKMKRILTDLGFCLALRGLKEEYWRRNQCHLAFEKRLYKNVTMAIEVHWALDVKREKIDFIPEMWDRIREETINGESLYLLSPEDSLLSIALHQRRFGKVLTLKYLCDLGLILDKYRSVFDWEYILGMARKYRLKTCVYFFLYALKQIDPVFPEQILVRLKIPRWRRILIERFIKRTLFEKDQPQRMKSRYLKAHFLLYDTLIYPIDYALNPPLEQFAQFYNLAPYAPSTKKRYQRRYLHMLWHRIKT